MKITREDVLRVAELAHLELSENEVELYRGQLDSILEYVEKLNLLDTTSVEPMAGGRPSGISDLESQIPSSSPETITGDAALRSDFPWPSPPIDPAEALRVAPDPSPAPAAAGGPGFFRVPKVIDR
jgi:aspartyl-tRNA(Asn)/glutamyl-tRNA(Gln) amidotransferase subunit C